jgi:MEDS: MEthanogen/methylotroph, DcmR Sensory domain
MERVADSGLPVHARAGCSPAPDHVVQFYDGDGFLCDAVARFLVEGLKAHEPLLIVATPAHREGIGDRLTVLGFDLPALCRSGRATLVDAEEMLSTFATGSTVDANLFRLGLGDVLGAIQHGQGAIQHGQKELKVRIFGEMVDVL